MTKTGILAQAKPNGSALLYRAPVDVSASVALTISNDGTGAAASVGVKPYDQKLTLDAATYKFHRGDVISTHRFALDSSIRYDAITPGTVITSTSQESKATFVGFSPPALTTIYVKEDTIQRYTVTSVGDAAPGDTVTKGAAPDDTTAIVYDIIPDGLNFTLITGSRTINGSGTDFVDGDILTTPNGSFTIETGGLGTSNDAFIFSSTTAGGTYTSNLNSLAKIILFGDRTFRFDVADTSLTGRDFRLSTTVNGEWGGNGIVGDADDGTEITTGKTVNGTAGSPGAYIEYDFSQIVTPSAVYYYDGGTGTPANNQYGGNDSSFAFSNVFTFDEIFVSDLIGTWTNLSDSFSVGGTLFTVNSQTSGKWGYVSAQDGASLEIVLGPNSSPFIATDTFKDLPYTSVRSTATVDAVVVDVTDIDGEHYILEGKSMTANTQERITSLVLGPGEGIVVNSASANNSFNVVGFEDVSDDFSLRYYPVD